MTVVYRKESHFNELQIKGHLFRVCTGFLVRCYIRPLNDRALTPSK